MNPKITKKHAIVLVVALIALFIIIVGGSYAFFTNTVRGKEYVIYSGTLAVSYEKKTNVVNLNNTKPMTNTEGLATTAYSFDVKNTGTIEEKYQVRLEEDTNNTLPLEYVKISVYKNDTELLKPTKLSELSTNLVIGEGELDSLDSDNYKVKLWLDINTPNDMVGKEFKARVVIDSMQNVEEGFAVNTKPIITLNKDSNNNTNLLLNIGDTYTELGVESVRDDKDTISTNSVAISGTVNTNIAGIYTVTYSVTDSDNNTSIVTRTVAVNDGSIPVYKGISNVLASFTQTELTNNETVICDHIYGDGDLYFNCEVKNTLENAIAARNVSTIILTNNLTKTSQINIPATKNIILDLNGYTITSSNNANVLVNLGTLTIDSSRSGGKIESTGTNAKTINSTNTSKLIIKNGYIKGTTACDVWSCSPIYVVNTSDLEITPSVATTFDSNDNYENGVYIESGFGIDVWVASSSTGVVNGGTYNVLKLSDTTPWQHLVCSNCNTLTINDAKTIGYGASIRGQGIGNIIVNGGEYTSIANQNITTDGSASNSIIVNGGTFITPTGNTNANVRNSGTGTITLNNGYFESAKATIANLNATGGIVNINGGTYVSNTYYVILNEGVGTVNITQFNNPIYMKTIAENWYPAVVNSSSGIINITANQANACTNSISDTTSGLCLYVPGSLNGGVVNGTNATGTININGGTYITDDMTMTNRKGIMNIKNVDATSLNKFAVALTDVGTTTICNSKVSGALKDLLNTSTGTFTYNNVTFSNGTTTPDSSKIEGTVTASATCPINN